MTKLHWLSLVLLGAVVSVTVACRSRAFSGGEHERKPDATPALYTPTDNKEVDTSKVFHGIYDVTVRSRKTRKVHCTGFAQIETYLDNTVITGKVPCTAIGVKEIEIGDGKRKIASELSMADVLARKLDSRVRYVTKDGDTEYIPHKPKLVGPIIQNPEKYRDLDVVEHLRVRYKTGDAKKPYEEASGSVHIKVLGINQTYKPENFPETFDRVIHYQINSTGFEGLSDKSEASIYQVYEYKWNTKPMRLLNIHIEGPVRDFEKSAIKGFLGDIVAFAGGLVIDMDLRELVPVTDNPLQNAIKSQNTQQPQP